MKWIAAVKSHGDGKVDERFAIGQQFDAFDIGQVLLERSCVLWRQAGCCGP